MRKYWPAVVAVSLIAATAVDAQQPTQAGTPAMAPAAEAQVGTAIENRMLIGASESFALGTQKLFCFSRVSNAAGSEIEHVWYKGDTEMGRVKLAINGSPWRTHSSKNLGEDAAGDWRCEVMHDGKVIQTARFTVQ
jgi:hypothetical protein